MDGNDGDVSLCVWRRQLDRSCTLARSLPLTHRRRFLLTPVPSRNQHDHLEVHSRGSAGVDLQPGGGGGVSPPKSAKKLAKSSPPPPRQNKLLGQPARTPVSGTQHTPSPRNASAPRGDLCQKTCASQRPGLTLAGRREQREKTYLGCGKNLGSRWLLFVVGLESGGRGK